MKSKVTIIRLHAKSNQLNILYSNIIIYTISKNNNKIATFFVMFTYVFTFLPVITINIKVSVVINKIKNIDLAINKLILKINKQIIL